MPPRRRMPASLRMPARKRMRQQKPGRSPRACGPWTATTSRPTMAIWLRLSRCSRAPRSVGIGENWHTTGGAHAVRARHSLHGRDSGIPDRDARDPLAKCHTTHAVRCERRQRDHRDALDFLPNGYCGAYETARACADSPDAQFGYLKKAYPKCAPRADERCSWPTTRTWSARALERQNLNEAVRPTHWTPWRALCRSYPKTPSMRSCLCTAAKPWSTQSRRSRRAWSVVSLVISGAAPREFTPRLARHVAYSTCAPILFCLCT